MAADTLGAAELLGARAGERPHTPTAPRPLPKGVADQLAAAAEYDRKVGAFAAGLAKIRGEEVASDEVNTSGIAEAPPSPTLEHLQPAPAEASTVENSPPSGKSPTEPQGQLTAVMRGLEGTSLYEHPMRQSLAETTPPEGESKWRPPEDEGKWHSRGRRFKVWIKRNILRQH